MEIASCYPFYHSGITFLGETQSLPKLPSNALDPATHISSSSSPLSSDLPQLTQITPTEDFLYVEFFLVSVK